MFIKLSGHEDIEMKRMGGNFMKLNKKSWCNGRLMTDCLWDESGECLELYCPELALDVVEALKENCFNERSD